jgi:signal peptidase I
LQYEIYPPDGSSPVSEGSPENPWRLGPDQYWVLGDFAHISADSRMWGPVPGANIIGVADLTYWPLSRVKIHR